MKMGRKDDLLIKVDQPIPIKNINYKELLRLKDVLEKLPVKGSFPIKKELNYAVRKLVKDHFPEYDITIRNIGSSYLVIRKA